MSVRFAGVVSEFEIDAEEMATANAHAGPTEDETVAGLFSVKCFKKALEMPLLDAASSSVGRLYRRVKSFNKLSTFGFDVVEAGVEIVARRVAPLVQKPLVVADNVACSALDGVKDRFPVVLKTPEEIKESGKDMVLKNSLVRASIFCMDKILAVVESVVTVAPVINTRTVTEARVSLKKLYRSSANHASTNVRHRRMASPRKRIPKEGIVDAVFSIPRKLLRFIGVLACHHRQLNEGKEPVEEITANNSSKEDRKRKNPDDEDEDIADLANKSFESYKSDEDADYEPSGEESVDSLEYRSGSFTDDVGEDTEHTIQNGPDANVVCSSPIRQETSKSTETVANNCVDCETETDNDLDQHSDYAAKGGKIHNDVNAQ